MKSAVILAAGEGKGTWPFSGVRQKVTVPVANVPMVRRLALDLLAVGIDEIVAVIGHRGEAVRACLGDLDAVRFVEQRPLAGPVDAALRGVADVTGDVVFICAGDIVTPRDTLARAVRAVDTAKADALVVTAPCPPDVPHWTTVETGADGLVAGVSGHGRKNLPRFGGIAAARTEPLKRYLLRNPGIMENVEVGAMPPPEGDLSYTFELMRRDGIEVHAIEAADFLVDVDRPWHIIEANYAAARHAIDRIETTVLGEGASIHDGADIAPGAKLILGPGAHIGSGCQVLGPAVLGPGARITGGAIVGPGVTVGAESRIEEYAKVSGGAVIGARSIISHCAEFTGVMFDVVYLYHYCCITALLGCNVDIGAATVCGTWRFDDGTKTQMVKGHRELPAAHGAYTYIGDYTRTGVNVMFMPGVKVGTYSCVGPGAIVSDDVPDRTLLMVKQDQTAKEWGPEKYGW
ncbi:MAG: NTP transferase domain-containing protein [Candidatus Hydrogenedentes bacterium]|nr:NTP transferase domain-containing protein [Candidatus Hydrogenedentota bacterium]